jgi:hypothetical protein
MILLDGIFGVADLGETLVFGLAEIGDGDVLHVLEGIIEVNLPAPFATLRGKPQIHGSDDGDAPTSFLPWEHHFWRCTSVERDPWWFLGGPVLFLAN